jgi:hypothetical protein
MNESTELAIVPESDLTLSRKPKEVLEEARTAAVALTEVISAKPRPVIMNGEQYLEFEDWQTLGRFYGVTAKVIGTSQVEIGDVVGFEAEAVAIHVPTGKEISRAESMCMKDENNWKGKPLFQLRSMAQTRACAKALRNVLAWVVVLAGFKPTPAEELERNGSDESMDRPATEKQIKLVRAKISAKAKSSGIPVEEITQHLCNQLGIESSKGLLMKDVDGALGIIADIDNEGGTQF